MLLSLMVGKVERKFKSYMRAELLTNRGKLHSVMVEIELKTSFQGLRKPIKIKRSCKASLMSDDEEIDGTLNSFSRLLCPPSKARKSPPSFVLFLKLFVHLRFNSV